MKVWIDAQLSPAIAAWINRTFDNIEAQSVRAVGLRDSSDQAIFSQARKANVVVITKDEDFLQLIDQLGTPPQVIWITCGNTSNQQMRQILSKTLVSDQTDAIKQQCLKQDAAAPTDSVPTLVLPA